jgi:hypothetical protein
MSSCIARRACADRNSFRLINEKGGTGKYIWTEFKCPNIVSDGRETCTECTVKLPKHKYQSNPKCDHGIIGGPYPSDSKLYGSPFYYKQIKEGWKPAVVDEIRAKEAIALAISQMPSKKKVSETSGVELPTATISAAPPIAAPEKKPRKPRVIKIKSVLPVIAAAEISVTEELKPKFLESMAAPKTITEVITVKVKKIKCQGKEYYFDSSSGKTYAAMADGVGPYKGRYNPETGALNTTYPDSDIEDV